ncbi:MAG: hypothetical protein HUJ72_03425 [Blautia sp.]|nr:hypothetical protein [Blautia sp.]
MNEIRDLIVGIDFEKEKTQMSFYDRKAQEPRSVSMKVGADLFEIPTMLCKRTTQGDYCVGIEAEYFAKEQSGILLDNLYEISKSRQTVQVGSEILEPWELLAAYIKGMLKYLGIMDTVKNTKCLAICTPELTGIQVENLQQACAAAGFDRDKFLLMDYGESFFHYVMGQKGETWNRSVAWYAFETKKVLYRKMSMNSGSSQTLVHLEPAVEIELPEEAGERDDRFSRFVAETMGTGLFSSVQITGEGFSQDWAKNSVRILCFQKRKVYYGNNLFSRGACYGARDKAEGRKTKGYRYISESMVRTNIGMEMRVMGAPAYHSLITAGKNWYDSKASCEFLLDDVQDLVFVVSDMEKNDKRHMVMPLPGLPKRPNKTTRLRLEMEYVSAAECKIMVQDLGFGDLFPSSRKVWKETVNWQEVKQ